MHARDGPLATVRGRAQIAPRRRDPRVNDVKDRAKRWLEG
jgi:hypothetical protein